VFIEIGGSHGESAGHVIYCIIGSRLTVTFAPPEANSPFFLEVPYSMIAGLEISSTMIQNKGTKSQDFAPTLVIQLQNRPDNCVINAVKQRSAEIKVLLADIDTLEYAHKTLSAAWKNHRELASQIGGILDATQDRSVLDEQSERGSSPVVSGAAVDAVMLQGEAAVDLEEVEAQVADIAQEHESAAVLGSDTPAATVNEATSMRLAPAAGKLTRLMSALSPEPDEPVGRSLVASSDKPTPTSKTNGASLQTSEPKVQAAHRPLKTRVQATTKGTVKNLVIGRKRVAKSKTARTKEINKENEDIFDVPSSEEPGEESNKMPDKVVKNGQPTKASKTKARGWPSKRVADGYQPSQPVGRIPESTCDSTWAKAAKKVVVVAPMVATDSNVPDKTILFDPNVPELDNTSSKSMRSDNREPLNQRHIENAPGGSEVSQDLDSLAYESLESGAINFDAQIGNGNVEINYDLHPVNDAMEANETRKILTGAPKNGCNSAAAQRRVAETSPNKTSVAKSGLRTTVKPRQADVPYSMTKRGTTRYPSVIDEQSARKTKIVSFGKSGPNNQGRRSARLEVAETLLLSEDSVLAQLSPPRPLHIGGSAMSMQQKLPPCPRIGDKEAKAPSKKRPQQKTPAPRAVKRQKATDVAPDDPEFVPIEELEHKSSTPKVLRSASQRSVVITDKGSPMVEMIDAGANSIIQDLMEPLSDKKVIAATKGGSLWQMLDRSITEDRTVSQVQETKPSSSESDCLDVLRGSSASRVVATKRAQDPVDKQEGGNALDPFSNSSSDGRPETTFVQRLATKVNEPQGPAIYRHDIVHTDAVEVESDSSTDMELNNDEVQHQQAEEEWEASLEPRHRDVLDMLCRIARRFVGHIVDCEGVLTEVLMDYFKDGEELLQNYDQKQIETLRLHHSNPRKGVPSRASATGTETLTKLKSEHTRLRDNVHEQLKAWKQSHDTQTEHILQLEALGGSA
jgi:hypothetical protein